jgi:hypothetical protein
VNRKTRRQLVGATAAGVLSTSCSTQGQSVQVSRGTAGGQRGFFSTGVRGNHWWFITPGGEPSFSLAMKHIGSSALRYPESLHIWRDKYGNSQKR